jgi:ketosteroid isomerase-like protein
MTPSATKDREDILNHIHSIFQAYLRQDREVIRRTHTRDWTGFQGPSTKIERGLDDYMVNAEKSLSALRGTGYELLDTEVQIYGDLAVVYYVARYDFRDGEGKAGAVPLRSVDIYRREAGEWNQCGSHITPVPANSAWVGPGQASTASKPPRGAASSTPQTLSPQERDELLAARKAVWRAWFAGDTRELRAVLPAETIAIDPRQPEWADRDAILARAVDFSTSGAKLIQLEFPHTDMQVYGDVVILYTTYSFETESDGQRHKQSGRGTEIFVRRDGRWLNSGWHLDSGE